MKKILIACEESQVVTYAFRQLGHEAFSCDILECSGGHPEWHIRGDVTNLLTEQWDLIIAFPPCTYLTVTGNRWFDIEKWGDKARERHKKREEAILLVLSIANANCKHIAIENPVGVLSTVWRKPDQIVQPFYFGDPFEKKTCLWLKGLPKLEPTNIVEPPPRKRYASGNSLPDWYAQSWNLPRKEWARHRSKTFPGFAKAMATQWEYFIMENKNESDC